MVVQAALLVNGVATARGLGVLDRGHLALFQLLATVLPIVTTMGLPLTITYWIAREPGLGRPLLRTLHRAVFGQLALTLLIHAGVLYAFFHGSASEVREAAALSLLCSPAIAVWSYGMAVLQANQRFRALNLSRMVSPAISAALTAGYLVAGVGTLLLITLTWVALYWLTAIITAIAAVRSLAPADPTPPILPTRRRLLSFGMKSLLGSVTPLEGFQLDQAAVGIFVSQRSLGLYVAAVAFTNLPRFISQNIGLVAYPHVAAERDSHGQRRALLGFITMTIVLCGGACVVIELALPWLVPALFGSAFEPAVGVAQILMISAFLFGLRRVLTEATRGAGRPALGSIAEIVSLAALFPAIAILYPSGAEGVATALVVAAAAGLSAILFGLFIRRSPHRRFGWHLGGLAVTDSVDGMATEL